MLLPALTRTALRGALFRAFNTPCVTPSFVTAHQRTLFASATCASPPAKAATSKTITGRAKATIQPTTATKTTSKTAAKPKTKAAATTKTKAAATTKAPAKPKPRKAAAPKAAPKPKKKVVVKPVVPKLTAEDLPPKRATTAYMLFANKYRAGQPKPTSLPEAQAISKSTAAVWHAMTAHEKQAFADEYAALKIKADAARAEWERTVDPAKLKLLNKKRAASGRNRVVVKNDKVRKPATPYLIFYVEWRQKHATEGLAQKELATRAGAAWRVLSAEEQKVYNDRYKKDMTAFRERLASESLSSSSA